MSNSDARKRELLKPPEIKPVLTFFVLMACIFSVGDPANVEYNKYCKVAGENAARGIPNGAPPPSFNMWVNDHSISPQKFFQTLRGATPAPAAPPPPAPNGKNGGGAPAAAPAANPLAGIPVFAIMGMCYAATTAQLGPLMYVINAAFWWVFGVVLEKKLIAWRYPLFLFIGMIANWFLLANEAEFMAPVQRFLGPTLFFCFMIGGYLVVKPKKPFKPQEWAPSRFKIFKGNDNSVNTKKIKIPWVSPWVYVSLFSVVTGLMYFLSITGGKELTDMTHIQQLNNFRQIFFGTLPANTIQLLRPIPALECLLAGTISCYIIQNIVFTSKVRREAGDMQVQAILQYKELRALDMNHKQAVEGTSKLIGVPLDIVKDWIAKGLQTPPSDDD